MGSFWKLNGQDASDMKASTMAFAQNLTQDHPSQHFLAHPERRLDSGHLTKI